MPPDFQPAPASLPEGRRVYAIGDVHGCDQRLARLHRLASRVVWANPLKARPGYAPLAAGMAAALPHVDDFVEGHSLAALERLAAVVAGARRAREGVHAHA